MIILRVPTIYLLPIPQSYNSNYDFFSLITIMLPHMVPTENTVHNQPRRSTCLKRTPTYLEEFGLVIYTHCKF